METEDEWKQKKEEIKRSKEIELENRELYYKNKDIERKEEWKRKKEEIKQSKEIELKKRELYFKNKENKQYVSEADDKKNKEIQQKVLEHRQRLQKMYDERISNRSTENAWTTQPAARFSRFICSIYFLDLRHKRGKYVVYNHNVWW